MATVTDDGEPVTTAKLMDDLQALVRDAEALLRATSELSGEKLREVRGRAEETLRIAKVRLASAEDEALRQARELLAESEEYVRQNPLQAVGIAAGVGLLLGLLLGRR